MKNILLNCKNFFLGKINYYFSSNKKFSRLKNKFNFSIASSYALIIILLIFTAFVPELFKSTNNLKIGTNRSEMEGSLKQNPSIDRMMSKKKLFENNAQNESLEYQQVTSLINLFEKNGYNLDKVREGEPVANFFLAKFPQGINNIDNFEIRKKVFIQILLPIVLSENQKIIDDRRKLIGIMNKKSYKKEQQWLSDKLEQYKVKPGNYKELLLRMDIVPPSLAIAQAAYESGWGTSRFAIEGNALFGQWSWKSSEGMVPWDRPDDSTYQISKFNEIRYAVNAYKNNLNTHVFYDEFRKQRAKQRVFKPFGNISGPKLVGYLHKYSTKGDDYILGLKKIIDQNSLGDFDKAALVVKRSGSI